MFMRKRASVANVFVRICLGGPDEMDSLLRRKVIFRAMMNRCDHPLALIARVLLDSR